MLGIRCPYHRPAGSDSLPVVLSPQPLSQGPSVPRGAGLCCGSLAHTGSQLWQGPSLLHFPSFSPPEPPLSWSAPTPEVRA